MQWQKLKGSEMQTSDHVWSSVILINIIYIIWSDSKRLNIKKAMISYYVCVTFFLFTFNLNVS